jgi:UDP-N-acetylmuramoyl-L-alanyl-D-glutamate--2,6-diaminopimelate ligase
MVRAGCAACVMEVSSHALDQKRVLGVDFDVAIFTNLTQDHLDWHGTMENYYTAKEQLFLAAGSRKEQAAVINIDDSFGGRLAARSDLAVQLTYGLSQAAKLRAVQLELGGDGSRFKVEAPGKAFDCQLPLIGRHNVYNALAAIGAALALSVDAAAIRAALEGMAPVPGRLESIRCGQPFGVYVDYAHTDDALINVLQTLREITRGRLLLVFGCGGSRDKGKRPKMGMVAARHADFSIITSDNPRKEEPAEIAAQIEAGYREQRGDGCLVELDRRRAIEEIIRLAAPGDTVLIAGKGHETYQEYRDTVVPFDDRVFARETLELLGFRGGASVA